MSERCGALEFVVVGVRRDGHGRLTCASSAMVIGNDQRLCMCLVWYDVEAMKQTLLGGSG